MEQARCKFAHLDDRGYCHEKCEDLAKRECELVFVGVVHPDFDAGHPVQKWDDDNRDEVDKWEIFAHDCQDPPEIETVRLAWRPDDTSFEDDRDGPGEYY